MKKIISISILAAALFLIGQSGLAAGDEYYDNPKTFGLERQITRIRSKYVNPERGKPLALEDKIVFVTSRKKILVTDLNGNSLNEIDLDFAPVSRPAVMDNLIFVGGDDGKFHCMDMYDGAQKWDRDFMTIDFSAPAVGDGLVVFQTASDKLVALNAETGEWAWESQHLRFDDLALQGMSRPVIDGGVIFVGLSGGSAAALELGNGRVVWKTKIFSDSLFNDVDSAPAVDDTQVYVVGNAGGVAALSRKTGKVFWLDKEGSASGCSADDSMLYAASDSGEIIAYDKATGKKIWKTSLFGGKLKSGYLRTPTKPVVSGGRIVTVTHGGKLAVLDKETGELIYSRRFLSRVSRGAEPVGADGFVFVDNKGLVRLWP